MDGNYYPDPASPVPLSDWTFSFWSQGTGAPVDNGTDGQLYIDTSTGDIYVYENNSWTVLSGGGGGGSSVLATVGNPEGVLTADERQFAWDATNNVLYIHEGADGTDTGWFEVMAA